MFLTIGLSVLMAATAVMCSLYALAYAPELPRARRL